MDGFCDLTKQFKVTKTLRWEIIPVGKTAENMDANGFLSDDKDKHAAYQKVKSMADDYYRYFIDECLSKANLDWSPLAEKLGAFQSDTCLKNRRELDNEKGRMKKSVSELFMQDPRFKNLFCEKLLSELLPSESSDDELETLKIFKKFSGYFIGYYENRRNIFGTDKWVSIAFRVVDDNFSRHHSNCEIYQTIKEKYPEILEDVYRQGPEFRKIDFDILFSTKNYNKLVKQEDIEYYNLIIGGKTTSETEKLRGINEFLNLLHQKDSSFRKTAMSPLYKQILSKKDSASFKFKAFENETDMKSGIESFIESMNDSILLERSRDLFTNDDVDMEKIYIGKEGIPKLSKLKYDNWQVLGDLLRKSIIEDFGDSATKSQKIIDKKLDSKYFSVSEIDKAISLGVKPEEGVFKILYGALSANSDRVLSDLENPLLKATEQTTDYEGSIKRLLDSILEQRRLLSLFNVDPDLPRDPSFYGDYDSVFNDMQPIVPLYNMCRNFVTRSPISRNKIKMNFKNGYLANGWDLSKEKDYRSFIFKKDGQFYLGVQAPGASLSFPEQDSPSDASYWKMMYKLLPDPKKMLPKVFFSAKGLEKYRPDPAILNGYEAGLHKKGDNFDIDFCHELIDFYKVSIRKNSDWDVFDFEFKDACEYGDIEQFYADVEKQGYRLRFSPISHVIIDDCVDNGKLYLFKIYSKDFSEKSRGRPNLHTIYWRAAFSEENLRDVVVKINGEAELFFREKTNFKEIVEHSRGSILVNRTTRDGSTIPNEVYYELFRYANGFITQLSERAKEYEDCICTHKAPYTIRKDRRFTEDKMLFHISLTLNYKLLKPKNINNKIIDKIRKEKELMVLGIDRGERNLIYYSLIDSSGKIVEQNSLNIIDDVNYWEKLDVRENDRQDSRKNWTSIKNIKNLKEGYVSQAVNKVCRLAIQNNALIALENLNYGFKRGRFKIEKQVYQTFERMLIEKLQYYVDKSVENPRAIGGVLNALQLAPPLDSLREIPKQCGIVFHVTPSYTSSIDPTTGFVNLFVTSIVDTVEKRRDFLSRMKGIRYSASDNMFGFEFDYRDFDTKNQDYTNKWTVYTNGTRYRFDIHNKKYVETNPTREISDALKEHSVDYSNGEDLRQRIIDDSDLSKRIFYAFVNTVTMRSSDKDSDVIVSPVKNHEGVFFRSDESVRDLPVDADANGAYHIALKGLQMVRSIIDSKPEDYKIPNLDLKSWFEFAQKG